MNNNYEVIFEDDITNVNLYNTLHNKYIYPLCYYSNKELVKFLNLYVVM